MQWRINGMSVHDRVRIKAFGQSFSPLMRNPSGMLFGDKAANRWLF